MTNVETMINFIETLLDKDIMFMTSDEDHLNDVLEAFKLARQDGKVNRKTIRQLIDHYRAAGEVWNKGAHYSDHRPIDERIRAVVENEKLGPVEYYFSVASAMNYVSLIYGLEE